MLLHTYQQHGYSLLSHLNYVIAYLTYVLPLRICNDIFDKVILYAQLIESYNLY